MTTSPPPSSPLGLHRVIDPPGVLPQAAWRLDASPEIAPDEVRVRVDRLNLDAASYRQLRETYAADPDKIRAAVLDIIATRGKMQNPVTGSGGMLTGTVDEVGAGSPLGLHPAQRIATLVSLTLTPLVITDSLYRWDGLSEQIPCEGHAILFARSIAAVLPGDLPVPLSLAVMDVCGAPALTQRIVTPESVTVIIGAAGKSGSLSAVAARRAGAATVIGVVPTQVEAALLREYDGLVDEIVIADARDPVTLAAKVEAAGRPRRRDRRVRGRRGLRGRCDLVDQAGRHRDLLLYGDVVQRGRARRGGARRRCDDAGGQRVRAWSRRSGPRPDPVHAQSTGAVRAARRTRGRPAVTGKLNLDPALVAQARELARLAGQPVVEMARTHTTVSVERAVLRLGGLNGADSDGMPWVNRLANAVRESVGLEHGVAVPVWDAMLTGGYPDLLTLAIDAGAWPG